MDEKKVREAIELMKKTKKIYRYLVWYKPCAGRERERS